MATSRSDPTRAGAWPLTRRTIGAVPAAVAADEPSSGWPAGILRAVCTSPGMLAS